LPGAAGELSSVLEAFLVQFYDGRKYVPDEVLVEALPSEAALVEEYLALLRGKQVRLRVPRRGAGRELMDIARKNAVVGLRTHRRDRVSAAEALEGLARALGLPAPPAVIECFDVSHLQGREVVASMVRFVDGRPDREAWRHYRLRSVARNDDFAAMAEILTRRYREASEGGTAARPDLIVVDGGKGQLSSACRALEALGMPDPPVVGLAKARAGKVGPGAFERVFVPGRAEPVIAPEDSPETLLLARIRDEAHRFAITYHRKLRSKAAVESALDRIEGIGDRWRRELLAEFGSVAAVRDASVEDLTRVRGLGRRRAMRILEHLREGDGSS